MEKVFRDHCGGFFRLVTKLFGDRGERRRGGGGGGGGGDRGRGGGGGGGDDRGRGGN